MINTITSPTLTLLHSFFLFSTAFLAGGLNAVAGGGSFITFPTLIFTGVSPITANATNNTAIWVAAVASAGAYRQDLDLPRPTLIVLGVTSLLGGLLGSLALLWTSPDIFKKLIPYLLLLATLVFVLGESIQTKIQQLKPQALAKPPPLAVMAIIQMAIATYGGFFGAGMGILMLATLTLSGIKSIHTINALKMFLGMFINGIAIIPFVLAGLVVWPQAILMAVGGALGGYFIARWARNIQPQIIKRFVVVIAISMTIYFFLRTA